MVFSSPLFLFLFLPTFLLIYYVLPQRLRAGWLLVSSYLFYGWWRVDFLGLIAGTSLVTYACALMMQLRARPAARGAALGAGLLANLGALAYFKYFNFGAESMAALLQALGGGPLNAPNVLLPVGISFYVLQAVSYLVDVYRRDIEAERNPVLLCAYIALFPQLVAGPILRYRDLGPQLRNRRHTVDRFAAGAGRFMSGLAKKVLIADLVAPLVDATFALPQPTFAEAWLGVAAYTIQIFFDFSAYSDMAIGLGRMMGFRFRENFDAPYLARTLGDFWRRWHMSLSSFLRDYLYIPLGGSRRGHRRTYLNLATVMVLGGLWHGAAWTFVLWGAWHGAVLIAERWVATRSPVVPAVRAAGSSGVGRWALTLLVVMAGWVLFRAASLEQAAAVYGGMLGLHGWPLTELSRWQLSTLSLAALAAGWLIAVAVPLVRPLVLPSDSSSGSGSGSGGGGGVTSSPAGGSAAATATATPARQPAPSLVGVAMRRLRTTLAAPARPTPRRPARVTKRRLRAALLTAMFALALLRLTADTYSPFLYFQF